MNRAVFETANRLAVPHFALPFTCHGTAWTRLFSGAMKRVLRGSPIVASSLMIRKIMGIFPARHAVYSAAGCCLWLAGIPTVSMWESLLHLIVTGPMQSAWPKG